MSPSSIVPSSSAVARTVASRSPIEVCGRRAKIWRSCRAAPPRLSPMARIPGWVCGRRGRESLHPSSSAVVRLVAPGRRTEQRSAEQLLRGSARWPAVPRRWGPAACGADRVCSRSRISGVADDVVIVGSPPSDSGMSQTSQAHAHHRGMDISHNTPPGGLVGASPEVVRRIRSPPSGAGTAARKEKNWLVLFSGCTSSAPRVLVTSLKRMSSRVDS